MDKQDELIGTLELVHPKLTNDPDNKKNKIGTILSADLENDNIVVGFGSEGQALFSMDALLMMRDPDQIEVDADNDHTLLPFWDYGDILEIISIARIPQPEYRKYAIQLSQKSPVAMEYTMQPLRNELGLERKNIISR